MTGASAVQVEIATGRLSGRRAGGVDRFLGIPFAQPPTGARRFRPPEPAAPWSGVREADAFGGAAPQNALDVGVLPGMEVGRQSEDCLYLNVYTPAADAGRRPVMVWIHGGGFLLGAGSQLIYDGAALAERGDVVVVTVNYRLGALGFLDLEPRFGAEFAGAANLGVLDQIAALAWVRENVAGFGGDPGNVTIFGESAGGMSVGTLLGCPAARGLYQRAIPQSGAAHNTHDRETAARVADLYLRALGASDPRALREASVEQILAAQLQCSLRVGELGVLLAFQPCAGERALPEPPSAAVRAGNAAGVPVLVGTTRDEWRLFEFLDPGHQKMDDVGFFERALARVGRESAAMLTDAYRKDAPDAAPADHFAAFETDRVFRVPAVRLADAQAPHAPVYGYEFAWPSPARRGALGSCHAIELPFVFGTLAAPGMAAFSGSGPEAERLSEVMMDTWTAFARSGDPSHAAIPAWPRHDATRPTMILDRASRLELAPRDRTLRAWEGLL
jgi:para-nitrobenzyl esterase